MKYFHCYLVPKWGQMPSKDAIKAAIEITQGMENGVYFYTNLHNKI